MPYKYRIYRNLIKKSFSIQQYDPIKKGYRLLTHSNNFSALWAEFKVSQAGRQRVLKTGHKNVHAFIYTDNLYIPDPTKGHRPTPEFDPKDYEEIYYNPRETETFIVKKTKEPIERLVKCNIYFDNNIVFWGKSYITKASLTLSKRRK